MPPGGYVKSVPYTVNGEPKIAAFGFESPRPLGAGLPVQWTIKSADDRPISIEKIRFLDPASIPPSK
jgi:hypothetical protein